MEKYQIKILKKMGKKPTEQELNNLNPKELDIYHYHRLKILKNKKHDYFELIEFSFSKKDIYSYKNIMDYDFEDWSFQKKFKTMTAMENKKYKNLYMPGFAFRCLEKIEILNKRKLTLDPFIYVTPYGEDMFKNIKNSKLRETNTTLKVMGKEKEFRKLTKKIFKLRKELDKDILKEIKQFKNATFRIKNKDDFNDFEAFIIGGKKVAKKISFKTFLPDFYNNLEASEWLNIIEKKLYKKYKKKIIKYKNKIEKK